MITSPKIETRVFFENAKNNHTISNERYSLLIEIASKIIDEYKHNKRVNINFICSHNSRRSQMSQVWAFFAVEYFNLENIFSYSGGVEVTAFHRNTVKCLQQTGFQFNVVDFSHQNPRYLITFKNTSKSILGFSKLFDNEENETPYIVITTCDAAERNCPNISDGISRFHLPFDDPKEFDNTDLMQEEYTKTSLQIAAEVFVIFEEVKKLLS